MWNLFLCMECGRSCGSVCPVLIFGYFKHNLFFKKVFSVQVIELTWNLGWYWLTVNVTVCFWILSSLISVYLFALFSALTHCPDFSSFMLSFFFFLPCQRVHGILVALSGIRSAPPELEDWTLNHWTTREVPYVKSWNHIGPITVHLFQNCYGYSRSFSFHTDFKISLSVLSTELSGIWCWLY